MNTKVVFVLVCHGDDYYYRQLRLSMQSLIFNSPRCKIEIVADKETASFLRQENSSILYNAAIHSVNLPDSYEDLKKSRWLKTNLRKLVSGDFLFLDTDTLVSENLAGVDKISADIAAVTGSHGSPKRLLSGKVKALLQDSGFSGYKDGPYFNTGVLFVKDTPTAHLFFENWHSTWSGAASSTGVLYDQPSFFMTNFRLGWPVKYLPDRLNCLVCSDMGIHFFKSATIIHWYSKNELMKSFVMDHFIEGEWDDEALQLARKPKSNLIYYRTKQSSGLYNRLYALVLYILRGNPRMFGWAERLNRKLMRQ